MAWSLKPMGDRVVVKPKSREETTKSGLVLPDTASERPQQGTVTSVGPGRLLDTGKRIEMDVKQGDTVLFAKYSGTEFKLEDEELLILSERDILAVIENGTK
jgi:chaperonin GroES